MAGGTGAKLPKLEATSRPSTSAWAIPWLLVIALILLGTVIWLVRRRRGRPHAGTSASGRGPAAGGPGGAGPNGTSVEPRVPRTQRVILRRSAPVLVGMAVLVAPAAAGTRPAQAPARTTEKPVVSVTPPDATPGTHVVLTLEHWPAGTVTLGV